jgi:hypothetical protein
MGGLYEYRISKVMMQQHLMKRDDDTAGPNQPSEGRWQAASLQKILVSAASAYRDPEHVSMWESWPHG